MTKETKLDRRILSQNAANRIPVPETNRIKELGKLPRTSHLTESNKAEFFFGCQQRVCVCFEKSSSLVAFHQEGSGISMTE